MAGMFALTTLGLITAAGPAMASAPAPIPLTSPKCPSDITEGEINGGQAPPASASHSPGGCPGGSRCLATREVGVRGRSSTACQ